MAFYECKEEICVALGNVLENALTERGLNVDALCKEYNSLLGKPRNEYCQALLMSGVVKSDPFPFTNLPYFNARGLIDRHLVQVFEEVLQHETTQSMAYHFARTLRRQGIDAVLQPKRRDKLASLEPFQKEIEKVFRWCERAYEIIRGMRANAPILATVTEEEKEFADSLHFDWYYSYSDQASTYRAGVAQQERVQEHAAKTIAQKPHLKKVIDAISKNHGFGPNFFLK